VTLIQGGWGTYNYQDMQYSQYSSIVGYAFIIVFAVLIVIIINNFLVAILANTYSQYTYSHKTMMLKETLEIWAVTEGDGKWSALVSGMPPLHVLNYFTAFIIFCPRNPEIGNYITLHLYYLPILIVVAALYIVYTALMIPICYLKMIPHKFALIYSKKSSKTQNTGRWFGSFILFFFLGIPILVLNWIVDISIFFAHMYWHDLEYIDTKIKKVPDVTMRTYDKLYDFLKSKWEAVLPYKAVASEIWDLMKVR